MSNINRINVEIATSHDPDASTNDTVYLGLGGREFRLDAPGNPHERGNVDTFILGSGGNTMKPQYNDPRKPQLDTNGDLEAFPVYIRKQGGGLDDDAWEVEAVTVTVNPGPGQIRFYRFYGDDKLYLMNESGHVIYLKPL